MLPVFIAAVKETIKDNLFKILKIVSKEIKIFMKIQHFSWKKHASNNGLVANTFGLPFLSFFSEELFTEK